MKYPLKDKIRKTGSLLIHLKLEPLSTCFINYNYETRWPKWTGTQTANYGLVPKMAQNSGFKMAHFIFPFGVVHFEVMYDMIDSSLEMAYFERHNEMGHFKV